MYLDDLRTTYGSALLKGAKIVQVLIGCVILILLCIFFFNNNTINLLLKTNLFIFLLSVLCWIFAGFLMSLRLRHIIRVNLCKTITLVKMFLINQLGMILSDFTPGRSGYFGIIYYLKSDADVPYHQSFGALIGVQLIDFFFKIIFSVLSVYLLIQLIGISGSSKIGLIVAFLLFTTIVIAAFILIWFNKILILKKYLSFLPFGTLVAEKLDQVIMGLNLIKPSWKFLCMISIIGTMNISLQWWLISTSIGINIPIIFYLTIPSLVSIIAFIPIGVAGIGIQELGVTIILIALGAPAEQAVLFSLLLRASNLIGDLTGLVKFFKK